MGSAQETEGQGGHGVQKMGELIMCMGMRINELICLFRLVFFFLMLLLILTLEKASLERVRTVGRSPIPVIVLEFLEIRNNK